MSTQTTNLHLVKPSDNERADNDVINANMDTIDAAVGDVDVAQDGSLQSQINNMIPVVVSEEPTANATRATSIGYTFGKIGMVSGVGNTANSISSHGSVSLWKIPSAASYQSVYINIYGYKARAYVDGNRLYVYNDEDTATIPSGSLFNFMAVYVIA